MIVNAMTAPRKRINARDDDAFDLVIVGYYDGPNPYLNRNALVFDFSLTHTPEPPPIATLHRQLVRRFPKLTLSATYAELFAQTLQQICQLDWGIDIERFSLSAHSDDVQRIAVECLHIDTTWDALYLTWDWWESLHQTQTPDFDFETRFSELQRQFNRSIYGGPTTYALLRAAWVRDIPTMYLPDEGLIQYGYGRYARRGIATTFDGDSHIDSDFTCRKDDCKRFLKRRGFPVPVGEVVDCLEDAVEVALAIGYPVVVKPLMGHKGIGVTAGIVDETELAFAWQKAVESLPLAEGDVPRIIVESLVTGDDYRLLCVNGRFVAALKREPAFVIGDGRHTLKRLIDLENATPMRADTATSPLGKIRSDDAMLNYLAEQKLSLDSIPPVGHKVKLRKVANLSLGGVSENVTHRIHPDNIALCNAIASQFKLLCLGIDALTTDISQPWQESDFGIIEINAAPGIAMHLNPAYGDPIDVPGKIMEALFPDLQRTRMATVLFNRLYEEELQPLLEGLQRQFPTLTIGGLCGDGVWLDLQRQPFFRRDYGRNIRSLLRHAQLDLMIMECWGDLFYEQGCTVQGAHLIILNDPSPGEKLLSRDLLKGGTLVTKTHQKITIRRERGIETHRLSHPHELNTLYLQEISRLLQA